MVGRQQPGRSSGSLRAVNTGPDGTEQRTTRSIVAIRPYDRRIRQTVFDVLEHAGADMEGAIILPKSTSDEEVVRCLAGQRPDGLLIPFHAHRDATGSLLNGLALAGRLDEECPHLRKVPMFMPISSMGMSSASLMLSRAQSAGGLAPEVVERILFMKEEDLIDPAIVERLKAHFEQFGK